MDIELIIKEPGLILIVIALAGLFLALGGGDLRDEGDPK